ncbi:MAG TPA: hypothetical protein DDY27_00910 [Hyphomonadaceae bacterium]|nr:hypothetical protein [Hyphomonadaceae bacterium]
MSNWLADEPPLGLGSTLIHEGEDIATREKILDKALALSEDIKKPEALKHACLMVNSNRDDVFAEMNDMAQQVAPFKALNIRCKVKIAPTGVWRGTWEASLEVSYTDPLGKNVTSSLPFKRIIWDKWHSSEADLDYASSLRLTNAFLGECFHTSLEKLRRPSDVANAAIQALASEEGCDVDRNGNTWKVHAPEGSGYEQTNAIGHRFRTALTYFCPAWSTDVSSSVPSVNDLESLCTKVHDLLDSADQEVAEIDKEGYGDYSTYLFKKETAERLTSILEQASRYKKSICGLSERLNNTHARMTQVMDNANSVAHGTTSHLFD